MNVSLEDAKELRRQLLTILKGHYSRVEIVPADGSSYRVLVLKRDRTLPELPAGVEILEDDLSDPVDNVNLEKTTPGKPSHPSKDLGKPLTDTNRNVEPPEDFRMRNRDIQDTVKRYAMTDKIASISDGIRKMAGRDPEIDSRLETIREALIQRHYKTNSKVWKTLQSVYQNYDIMSAEELLRRIMDDKFTNGSLEAAKQIVVLVNKRNGISPSAGDGSARDIERQKLAKLTAEHLAAMEKITDSLVEKLRRLGLKEEANQMHSMVSSLRDIYSVVSRIEK